MDSPENHRYLEQVHLRICRLHQAITDYHPKNSPLLLPPLVLNPPNNALTPHRHPAIGDRRRVFLFQ